MRRRIGPGLALFGALTYFNVSTFGFHVVVSRELGPASYGALGAVLALTSLAGNASGAVTAAVTRTVAVGGETGWDVRRASRRGLVAGGGALAAITALAPALERYLHLQSPAPVLWLAVMAAATLAGLVPRGALMGQRRFGPVAGALTAGVSLKLVAGAALAALVGVSGAVAAAALGELVSTGLYFWSVHERGPGERPLRVPLRSSSLAIGAYCGFWLLAATDTFLARHLLSATAAGLYVAASTAGSIALFLPNNVTLTAFPSLATGRPDALRRAAPAALGLSVASVLTLAVMPGVIVAILFGPSFRGAAGILALLAVSNGAQGMASLLLHHQLAHHRLTCLLPWVGLVALTAVIYAGHHSAHQVAVEAMAVSVLLAGAMGIASVSLVQERNRVLVCEP